MNSHGNMDAHVSGLSKSMNAVVALFFDGRIPPAREMDHMGRCSKSETGAGCFRPQNKNIESAIFVKMPLESVYDCLTLRNRRFTIDEVNSRKPELGLCELDEAVLHFLVLNEDKCALPLYSNLPQYGEGTRQSRGSFNETLGTSLILQGRMHRHGPNVVQHLQCGTETSSRKLQSSVLIYCRLRL